MYLASCSAMTSGQSESGAKTNKDTPWRVLGCICLLYFGSVPAPDCPLWMRRGAQGQTDQGKNLFERSELFLTPSGPSTAGCPQRSGGTQEPGSPFLCLRSFGEAKESRSPAGARPGSGTETTSSSKTTKRLRYLNPNGGATTGFDKLSLNGGRGTEKTTPPHQS